MAYRITVIPGDGIGPDVIAAACTALEATGVEFEWDRRMAGLAAVEEFGTPLPEDVLTSIRRNRVALKGPLTTPADGPFRSANIGLRRSLDLYAQVRPCKSYAGAPSAFSDLDLIVIRETTEDLYAGIEFEQDSDAARELADWLHERSGVRLASGSAISLKPISEAASRRICSFAWRYARENERKRITVVHKAAVMKATDGVFLDAARSEAMKQPGIEFDDVAVDSLALRLVRRPNDYDVLVLPNLYGDIVSDLAAGLVGGIGLAPGGNFGDGIAVFEAAHGSAPKYAGLDRANPFAMILSGVMMLRHLNETQAADLLEGAVAAVIADGTSVTPDMKSGDGSGACGTAEAALAVVEAMRRQAG